MKATQLLTTLFERHHLDLRRLIGLKFSKMGHEAEDIVQEAFHNLLRAENIDQLENPKAYLYQTASNLALNRIRKNKHHDVYLNSIITGEDEDLDERTPERIFSGRDDLERIENALTQLPSKYRKTFVLSRVHEKSYREISEILGISESTVEKHIIKTLKYLRDHLREGVEV
jgi:RNA polymerase sigma factor (sigma-70 family)